MSVLYDGWALVYRPDGPAALHLLTLLAAHPPRIPAIVALPGDSLHSLPEMCIVHTLPVSPARWGRLQWEQRLLPRLARQHGAGLLHLTSGGAPLFTSLPCLFSPATYLADDVSSGKDSALIGDVERPAGLPDRLRHALGQGGLARLQGWLWPADLPAPEMGAPCRSLPPAVHPAFTGLPEGDLQDTVGLLAEAGIEPPMTYVLYNGPTGKTSLRNLLAAWSWAAVSIGEYHPLLLAGMDAPARQRLAGLLAEYSAIDTLSRTILPLPPLPLPALAGLYRSCSAVFHPALPSPWSGALRLALACAKPVVSLESRLADALVGPAGYLVKRGLPAEEARALGAALITVVVEETVSAALQDAARRRSSAWQIKPFSQALGAIYDENLSV